MTVATEHYDRFWMLANANFQAYAVRNESDSHAGFAQAFGTVMRDAVMFDLDTCVRHCREWREASAAREPMTTYVRGLIAGYDRAIYYLQGGMV